MPQAQLVVQVEQQVRLVLQEDLAVQVPQVPRDHVVVPVQKVHKAQWVIQGEQQVLPVRQAYQEAQVVQAEQPELQVQQVHQVQKEPQAHVVQLV